MKLLNFSSSELTQKLQSYLEGDPIYLAVYEHARIKLEASTQLTAHNWMHSYRTLLNAIVIGEAEGADMSVVLPAAAMYDIGFLYGADEESRAAVSADKLRDFLREGDITYSDEAIHQISECMDSSPTSLEAMVVADAVLLEKFGPLGVYQIVRSFKELTYTLNAILGEGASDSFQPLTETGKKLAEPGRQFVIDFFNELKEAVGPYMGD